MPSTLFRVHGYSQEGATNDWESTHNSLSKVIRKAARVALGKDPTKVQKYTMSGIQLHVRILYEMCTDILYVTARNNGTKMVVLGIYIGIQVLAKLL